ncbi:MAG: ABC transporter ATP-binding protein [Acetatifactor sp.]|nr:ABC transporter ATP-binding protein [Acetatifactor sp.]
MIEVTDLTKRYGDHIAVDHLSFKVEKGQIYGFLGPNGAGKSTTMNIITGYLAASEGRVTIDGHDVQQEPEEAKKRIGYLPELPPLYMDMTVEEYLRFAAELKKVPRAERREQVEQVMGMTQVTDMRGRLIKNLSKGYRQRVGLAQALLGSPEVLILDEPSVGLDPKQIIEIRDLIRELGKSHTIILSSHILSEVSAVCDHIMIISHGKLVASDSPEGLQKLMSGEGELKLTVKGSYEALQEAVTGMAGIQGIERLPGAPESGSNNSGQDYCNVLIKTDREQDIREELFYLLAEKRLPILSMALTERSLEDIFLELTGETDAPEEPVKKGYHKKNKEPQAERIKDAQATGSLEARTEEADKNNREEEA